MSGGGFNVVGGGEVGCDDGFGHDYGVVAMMLMVVLVVLMVVLVDVVNVIVYMMVILFTIVC